MSNSTDTPGTAPRKRGRPPAADTARKSRDVADLEAQRDAIQLKIDRIKSQQLEEANRAISALGTALLRDPAAPGLLGEWLQKAIGAAKGKEKAGLELASAALAAMAEHN